MHGFNLEDCGLKKYYHHILQIASKLLLSMELPVCFNVVLKAHKRSE